MKTVIFDIDGTLADLSHRLHHVRNGNRNWDAFFNLAGEDLLHAPIRDMAIALSDSYRVVCVSGRPEKIRDVTTDWLISHRVPFEALYMRPDDDYRQDTIIKAKILEHLRGEGHDIAFTVDDRPSVVAMWRENGLTCLQCRDWHEEPKKARGLLTVMVGPSGSGKTTWLKGDAAAALGIHSSHIISSDQIRADLCGDWRDQSKNDAVFAALHAVARERLNHGLPTVIDATNIRRRDRLACSALGDRVRYVVIDRPLPDKIRDRGDRPDHVVTRHDQTFRSQLADIFNGDSLGFEVIDRRAV